MDEQQEFQRHGFFAVGKLRKKQMNPRLSVPATGLQVKVAYSFLQHLAEQGAQGESIDFNTVWPVEASKGPKGSRG